MKKEATLSKTETSELATTLRSLKIWQIAKLIKQNWTKPYFGAVPYINAMMSVEDITDRFGFDPATEIVNYFLGNASTWRGETAKAIKAELKRRVSEAK